MKRANFGAMSVTLQCPVADCDSSIVTDMNTVAANATVVCPRGHTVKLNTGSNELQQSFSSLNKSFDRLNRRLGGK